MKRNVSLLLVLSVISCLKEQEIADYQSPEPQVEVSGPTCAPEIPGVAMAMLSDTLVERLERMEGRVPEEFAGCGVCSMERLFPHAGEFEPRTRASGLHKWYRLTYDESLPLTKAGAAISSIPGVELVEPELQARPTSLPFDDPYLAYQWHYCNNGNYSHWKEGADINVFKVWEYLTTGDPSVVVAVVDGGIDTDHEDLAAHVDLSRSHNFVYGHTGSKIYAHEHGTHVAGTIAAVNNNGKGVCGIAGGDKAKGKQGVTLISCQIFQTVNGKEAGADSAAAIKWGADHGAVISQNSWGVQYQSEEQAASASTPQYLKDAIEYFNRYAGFDARGRQVGPMAGGVVFFAAGNDGWAYDQPAEYEGCIAVGSFTASGERASYSNYGDWVDIAAPGGDSPYGQWQESNVFYSSMIASTVPGGKYASYPFVGTSMACPHVSGVAALLVSFFGGPGFTREDLIRKLLDGADQDYFPGSKNIGPKLNAWNSFAKGNKAPVLEEKINDCSAGKPGSTVLVDLDKYFSDPEGLTMSYGAESENENIVEVEVEDNILTLHPKNYGETQITVTASDLFGSSAQTSFTAVVRDNSIVVDIYPNPVGDVMYLRTANPCNASVRVFSLPGREVVSVRRSLGPTGTEPVDMSAVTPGTYTVSVAIDGGRTYTRTIVKI